VIEGNTLRNNRIIDGAIGVFTGTGNQITRNRMTGNLQGITLGGAYRYNGLHILSGPNDLVSYPTRERRTLRRGGLVSNTRVEGHAEVWRVDARRLVFGRNS
jgi:hypothetical protein